MKFIIFLLFLIHSNSWAGSKVAIAKLLRGQVEVMSTGKNTRLKLDDWVEEGSIIKTADKSFVKLVFTDKSQMNLGPSSEMRIEKFNGKEAGVIDIVKGKVRSQVTKDYLQMDDTSKSKLFIKSNNAAMGVRGTDFLVSTNGNNTAVILFEGEVVFNNLPEGQNFSNNDLDEIVDRGVPVRPGEFSVVESDRPWPTVPAVLNPMQREALESNETFNSGRTPNSSPAVETKSIVPDGLSGQNVSNKSETLMNKVQEVSTLPRENGTISLNPEGLVSGDMVRPANGSFLHLDSGVVIPPAANSVYDPNTKSFISGSGNGSVDADGDFIPPANVTITSDGKLMMTVQIGQGEMKTVELPKMMPVITSSSMSFNQVSQTIIQNPSLISSTGTIQINTPPQITTLPPTSIAPPPSGGIDLNTAVLQRNSGRLDINVIK